jgi:hypothetical protein
MQGVSARSRLVTALLPADKLCADRRSQCHNEDGLATARAEIAEN